LGVKKLPICKTIEEKKVGLIEVEDSDDMEIVQAQVGTKRTNMSTPDYDRTSDTKRIKA